MRAHLAAVSVPVLTVSLSLGALAAPNPAAFDFPQWRGPARDGTVPLKARATWPEALTPGWKVKVGVGHASPIVVGDRVLVFAREGEEEVAQSFELATGKRVWRQAYRAPYSMNPAATSLRPRHRAACMVAVNLTGPNAPPFSVGAGLMKKSTSEPTWTVALTE